MLSYEVFMGLSLMGVVALAGSFSLGDIIGAQKGLWFCVKQPVGLAVFLVAGLAEARRLPFDLPEAENELVAGFHTEYSGMKFAMFFLGEYVGGRGSKPVTFTQLPPASASVAQCRG